MNCSLLLIHALQGETHLRHSDDPFIFHYYVYLPLFMDILCQQGTTHHSAMQRQTDMAPLP